MAKQEAKKKKSKMNSPFKSRLLLVGMLLTSIAVLPTTLLIFIGMMPTIIARFTEKTRQGTRVLTIGFMNFAGCFPFWFKLMQSGHKFEAAVALVTDPFNIVIMYGSAVVGYMIEWGLAGFVAGLMVQKGRKRLDEIKKIQEDITKRWGPEVTGDIPLDRFGFPVSNNEQ